MKEKDCTCIPHTHKFCDKHGMSTEMCKCFNGMDDPECIVHHPYNVFYRYSEDKLEDAFERQRVFMNALVSKGKMSGYPVDLTTKEGQKNAKEVLFCLIEELMEASFTLKNKAHRLTDDKQIDFEHYAEELGDAFAFFMELCIFSGITPDKLYKEYVRKNRIVHKRLQDGY